MFCFSSPAVRRMGRVYSRSSCSDSVSRRIEGPLFSCARTGATGVRTGATASAAATVAAVRPDVLLPDLLLPVVLLPDVLLRSEMRSNMGDLLRLAAGRTQGMP